MKRYYTKRQYSAFQDKRDKFARFRRRMELYLQELNKAAAVVNKEVGIPNWVPTLRLTSKKRTVHIIDSERISRQQSKLDLFVHEALETSPDPKFGAAVKLLSTDYASIFNGVCPPPLDSDYIQALWLL